MTIAFQLAVFALIATSSILLISVPVVWMSNCPGGNDSILYLNQWLTFSK